MDSPHITPSPGDTPRPVVALVAHDGRKQEMAEWAAYNRGTLERCTLFATRTTGRTLVTTLGVPVRSLLSGPLGGDAQLGSLIAEGASTSCFSFGTRSRRSPTTWT